MGKIRCLKCNTILESKYRHDFQECECGNFVDGGNDYMRIGGDASLIQVWCEEKKEWINQNEII